MISYQTRSSRIKNINKTTKHPSNKSVRQSSYSFSDYKTRIPEMDNREKKD